MEPITLIKLGGSIITEKSQPYTLRPDIIHALAKEFKKYKKPLILAHGAGSFAHTSANKYGGMKGYVSKEGLARVAHDVMYLNSLVMNIFLEEKLPAISFRPLSNMLTDKGKLKSSFFSPIENAIKQGFIPVVYGDILMDLSWKTNIYSGEKILTKLAFFLQKRGYTINRVIEIGTTNGVYDKEEKTIDNISAKNWRNIKDNVIGSDSTDVTGGMYHKVTQAMLLAKQRIPTFVINGSTPKQLYCALNELPIEGTRIV